MIAAKKLARPAVVVAGVMAAGLVLILAAGQLGVRWDPFGWERGKVERAEARAIHAEAEAAARTAEVLAERAQAVRLERHLTTIAAVERATETLRIKGGGADDAHVPLETDRADRLRAHDRELCRLAPDLEGCAASAGTAGGGATSVRPGDLAV